MNSEITVLYISHVQWNWIKQRPQYLAGELSKHFNVIYFQPQVHRNQGLKPNSEDGVQVEELPRIPSLRDKVRLIKAMNDHNARKLVAAKLDECSSPVVWLASPSTLCWVPASYKGKLVYDCMDDHSAFANGSEKQKTDALERKLVERADLVLASSSRLANKIRGFDATGSKDVLLVRNGFDGKVIDLGYSEKTKPMADGHFKACYFGTIGPWFDFGAVQESLFRIPNLAYKIIGPVDDGVELFQDERIEYTGPVAHDALGKYVADCDCFVMPFQINDIVLSVDPVKMYEYINFGKDVVCVRYPEVERFADYAVLYDGVEDYCSALQSVMDGSERKYSDEQRLRILDESSWTSRMEPVMKALDEL